jgi:5'-deoxynucleotidase
MTFFRYNKDIDFIAEAVNIGCTYLQTLDELSAGNKQFKLAKTCR